MCVRLETPLKCRNFVCYSSYIISREINPNYKVIASLRMSKQKTCPELCKLCKTYGLAFSAGLWNSPDTGNNFCQNFCLLRDTENS